MTNPDVWIVQEEPTGAWIMGCSDCTGPNGGFYSEAHATKTAAMRAAREHRAEDRAAEAGRVARLIHACPRCGKPA